MDDSPQEITSLVGREVYTTNGVYVGAIEDLQLDVDGGSVTGLALADPNDDLFAELTGGSRGVLLPYRWIRSVGDVVLVSDVIERVPDTIPEDDEEEAVV